MIGIVLEVFSCFSRHSFDFFSIVRGFDLVLNLFQDCNSIDVPFWSLFAFAVICT